MTRKITEKYEGRVQVVKAMAHQVIRRAPAPVLLVPSLRETESR